jgi:hypothetical protein
MTNQTISKNQMNFEQFTIKTEQQQQIIENQKNNQLSDDVLSSTNHHFYKTHDNHNIVYFIH